MNVACRSLAAVLLLCFAISGAGLLVDLDHYGSLILTGQMQRSAHGAAVALVGGVVYGSVVWAFAVRWLLVEELPRDDFSRETNRIRDPAER